MGDVMTESQWLACSDPAVMLEGLGRNASARKVRLFACACCRRVQEALPHVWNPAILEVAERFADGLASVQELRDAARRVNEVLDAARRSVDIETHGGTRRSKDARRAVQLEAEYSAHHELSTATRPTCHRGIGRDAANAIGGLASVAALRRGVNDGEVRGVVFDAINNEKMAQADLLRDLFSDQFRPVVPHPEWFTSTVMALAGNIYENHAFDLMPILADALQDAGCDDEIVLSHCRGSAAHARGCWVVDLVLGKV